MTGVERTADVWPHLAETVIAISLKQYMDVPTTVNWAQQVGQIAREHSAVTEGRATVAVLPSLPAVGEVSALLESCLTGAQDIFYEDRGSFTGGVSAQDVAYLGCSIAEVGHAERAKYFHESPAEFSLKVEAAWRNSLVPLICVGELHRETEQRAGGEVVRQLQEILPARLGGPCLFAYEPVWAIGQQDPAPIEWVCSVTSALRSHLANRSSGSSFRILYGGSARPGLLPLINSDVDSLFLGRFAHDPSAVKLILDEVIDLSQNGTPASQITLA